MEKYFIKYETALSLKKMFFNDETYKKYYIPDNSAPYLVDDSDTDFYKDYFIPAPTYEQAFLFLFERLKTFEIDLDYELNLDLGGWFLKLNDDTFINDLAIEKLIYIINNK